MPRKRRIPKARKAGFGPGDRLELLLGHTFTGEGFGDDEESRRAAWFEHREELLSFWTQNKGEWRRAGAGTRPWAWWRYEAPEPRRRISGTGTGILQRGLSFGTAWAYDDDYDPHDPPQYEPESEYLERLGLLTDEERKALGRTAEEVAP